MKVLLSWLCEFAPFPTDAVSAFRDSAGSTCDWRQVGLRYWAIWASRTCNWGNGSKRYKRLSRAWPASPNTPNTGWHWPFHDSDWACCRRYWAR